VLIYYLFLFIKDLEVIFVQKRYQHLEREEIRGLSVYVPGKPIDEVKRELGLKEVYKLASNENPWGPSPKALEAMHEAINEVSRYPDAEAYRLKNALAESFQVQPDQIMFGSGSDQIIQIIATAFFRPGDEILMGNPSFPRYETVTSLMGATPVEVPLVEGYYPLEEIAKRVTPKTRAIFICNPNNPSGTVRDEETIRQFVEDVPKDVLLIFDEAYFEFTKNRFSGSVFLSEDRPILILRTFSKAFGLAGVRLGFAIGDAELIAAMNRVREAFNVNSVAQAGALAAWKDQEYLESVVQKTVAGREYLMCELESLGVKIFPSETNFVMGFFPMTAAELNQQLLKRGLIVRPGAGYKDPNAIRISIGSEEENELLIQTLREILG
jgi:histidinol-phosphate aminotransferase